MSTTNLEDLFSLLRFASVSTDPAYDQQVRGAAEWLEKKLRSLDLETKIHETPGHPVVTAKNKHVPGRKTVLIYGHYDVQPADPFDEWHSKPFEPVIKENRIICRGATDNKGQLMAHVAGLEKTLKNVGELPVNVTCVFEGEEEIGSPNFPAFVAAQRDYLKCDVVVISDTGMVAPGVGTLTYALRGNVGCEVTAYGPKEDLHSGSFGGSIANPATAIARLVASLHDKNGRIQIPGFYEDVRDVQDWERKQWAELGDSESEIKSLAGVGELFGEAGYSDLERRWARPTAEINGLGGGYQGDGGKTIIPKKAFVKMTFRMVPNQDPEKILKALHAHIHNNKLPGVRFEISGERSSSAYLMEPNSAFGKVAQTALEKTFNKRPALIREGGTIQIVNDFRRLLGVDSLLLGLALPDCGAHAPNENFPIENFEAGIKLNQILLEELAKA